MSIDSATWGRLRLEKQGYRSEKHLSSNGVWWFSDFDVLKVNKIRKFVETSDNGSFKSSPYYKLTDKGLRELKKSRTKFRFHTRGEKLTKKEKNERHNNLLEAFSRYSFHKLTIWRFDLECNGWIPSRTFNGRTPNLLIKSGIVEKQIFPKIEKNMSYYRLTAKGKKILQAIKLNEEISNYPKEILELKKQQAAQDKALLEKHKSELKDSKADHNAQLKDLGIRHIECLSGGMKIDDVTMWSDMTQEVKLPGRQNTTLRSLPLSRVNKLLKFRKNFKLPKNA